MKKIFQNLISKIKKQPKLYWVASLVFIVLSLVFLVSFFGLEKIILIIRENSESKNQSGDVILDPVPPPQFQRFIDGVGVNSEEEMNPQLFAVMIENIVESRPAIGLSKASLVYEAISEAGITRFLAFYPATSEVGEIGPVRSARLYYLDWAEEYEAVYAHCGGSPEAMRAIWDYEVFNLDQFSNAKYFWRSGERHAPHNLYTSIELLNQALQDKDWPTHASFDSWQFKDEAPEPQEQEITIEFSSYNYQVSWRYDQEKNDYLRMQAGEVHKDADGSEIRAKNIVVQFVKMWILDEIGRKKIETIGGGKALIFQDGKSIEGEWKKEKRGDRTKFYDQDGLEIKINPGLTWIEVAPNGTETIF